MTNLQLRSIEKKLQTIKNYYYTPVQAPLPIKYLPGDLVDAPRPDLDDSDWLDFSIGQFWGGHDKTCWFRLPFRIKKEWMGKKLAAIIQPGKRFVFKSSEGGDLREYELLVYLNGEPLQSIDVRRNEIPLWDKVTPNKMNVLALEAFSGLESHQHCLEQADLVLINEEVQDFYFNAKMALDTITAIGAEHSEAARLIATLDQALLRVDFSQQGKAPFFYSIAKANEYLLNHLYGDSSANRLYASVVCLGHSHLDLAWKWQTKHGIKKAARTSANALRLMELYPSFRFTQSQAQLYKWVQEYYPQLFARIKAAVRSGQWEVTGGMWVEADCNIPGGESLVRQFLYGKRYFRRELGVDPQVAWLPDSFGFCYTLPQIMQQCSMRYFMTTKLSWNQFCKFPYDTFYWEGLDGTRILAHMITTPDRRGWNDYSVDLTPANVKACWDNYRQPQENNEVLLSFGWGDGGGGPTREMLESAQRLDRFPYLPLARQGQAEKFFSDLEQRVKSLPVWNDELYLQYHRGTYTSQAGIKKNNRLAEVLLHNAELFCVMDFLRTGDYPQEDLNRCWELVLLNQFHDILPGSSIAEVYRDSEGEFGEVRQIASRHLESALRQISSRIVNDGKQEAIIVFNPLSWSREDLVSLAVDPAQSAVEVIEADGEKVPTQVSYDGKELLFATTATPSLGHQTFRLVKESSAGAFSSSLKITTHGMENGFFAIAFDERGWISSIFDKRNDREVVGEGCFANVLQAFEDRPLANDAWDIDIFYQDKRFEIEEIDDVRVIERGPVRGGILQQRHYLDSMILQRIFVYERIPRIDFVTEIDWRQHQTLLKVAFPVAVHANKATYEIPYGNIERPTHWNTDWDRARFEVPAQKWADLSEGDYGVSLLNDCKYGYDIRGNVIRLTLLKSAVDPDPNADIGHHSFCYSLYPHAGDWRHGQTVQRAYELNYPLLTQVVNCSGEKLRMSADSFAKVSSANVMIEAVKKAEDSDRIILRLYEAYNQRGKVELEFAHDLKDVRECNCLEQEYGGIPFEKDKFRFNMRPYEIKTFLLQFTHPEP